jgi:hypothetical protein
MADKRARTMVENLAGVDEDGTTRHRHGAMAERLARVDEDGTTAPAGPELAGAQTSTAPTRRGGETAGRQGWPELEARWPARKTTPSLFSFFFFIFQFSFFFLIFNWADKWALLSMSASLFFLCQLSAYSWVPPVRFGVNLRSVQIANNFLKSCGFLRLKRKAVVFEIPPLISWFYANHSARVGDNTRPRHDGPMCSDSYPCL